MADGELAFDLQSYDEEENRQERMVDPVKQSVLERVVAKLQAEFRFPGGASVIPGVLG